MATLYFTIEADYHKVIEMKKEVNHLEAAMSKMKLGSKEWEQTNARIKSLNAEIHDLTDKAAKAGAELENKLRNKVKQLSADLESVDKKMQLATAEAKKYTEQIKSLEKQMEKASDKKSLARQIDELNGKLMSAQERIASLKGQKAEIGIKFKKENKDLMDLLNNSSRYEKGMFSTEIGDSLGKMTKGLFEANREATQLKNIFLDIASTASGVSLGNIMTNGVLAGYGQLKDLMMSSIRVRKEMQDIESNMSVFLKSKDKATSFTRDLSAEAYYNMNEFSQLVSASKEMIAYGNKVDEIIPRIHQLSEISTGTGQSLGMLVSMYNRAKSVGYVDSRTQQTWASQGIVLQDQLKAMGENVGSKITFEQLNKVIDRMTSEGGMFAGVQADMMSNVSAEEGQLADNLHAMHEEIGKILEGPYVSMLKMQEEMVQNWRDHAETIGAAVAALGAYRASLVIAKVTHELINGQAGEFTQKIEKWAKSFKEMADESEKDSLFSKLKEKFNEARGGAEEVEETKETLKEAAATAADTASKVANTAAEESNAAATAQNSASKGGNATATSAEAAATAADTAVKNENTAAEVANSIAKGKGEKATNALGSAIGNLTKQMGRQALAFVTNPYVIIAAAVAAVVGYIVKCSLEMEKSEQVTKEANEALKEHAAAVKEAREEEQKFSNIIADGNRTINDRLEALNSLLERTEDVSEQLSGEFILSESDLMLDPKDLAKKISAFNVEVARLRKEILKENNVTATEMASKYQGFSTEYGATATKKNADGTYSNISSEEAKRDFDEMVSIFNPEWLDETNKEAHKIYESYEDDLEKQLTYIQLMGAQGRQNLRDQEEAERIEEKQTLFRREWYEKEKQRVSQMQKALDLSVKIHQEMESGRKSMDSGWSITISKVDARKQSVALAEDAQVAREEMYKAYEATLTATAEEKDKANALYQQKVEEYIQKANESGMMSRVLEILNAGNPETGSDYRPTESVVVNTEMMATFADKKGEDLFDWVLSAEDANGSKKITIRTEYVTAMEDENGEYRANDDIKGHREKAQQTYKEVQKALNDIAQGNMDFSDTVLSELTGQAKTSQKAYSTIIAEFKSGKEIATSDLNELVEELRRILGESKTEYESAGGNDITGDKALAKQKARIQEQKDLEKERQSVARQQEDAMLKEEQNIINTMAQGAERQRRQRKLDHDKAVAQIERQFEDEQRKAKEAAQKRWETTQKNNSEEGKVGIFNEGLISGSNKELYDAEIALAERNKEDRLFEEQTKYLGIDAIVAKYDKSKNDYAKAIGEMAVELDKLGEHRDALVKRLESADEKDKADIAQQIEYYNVVIGRVQDRQRFLLDDAGKAREQYLKTYGSIFDQMDAIIQESKRKIAESAGDEWSKMNINSDAYKAIAQAIEKDMSLSTDQKIRLLNDSYQKEMVRLDDEIREYHAKSLDEQLTDEQRADALRLENAAKTAKQRMAIENTQSVGKMSVEAITKSPDFFAAMQSPEMLSSQSLSVLRERLEGARKELSNLDPKDLKVVTDLLDKMLNVDIERDPFKAMESSAKELSIAQTDLAEKTSLLTVEREKLADIEERLKMADDETREALEAQRNEAMQSYTNSLNAYENAVNRVISANARMEKANTAVVGQYKDMVSGFRSIGDAIAKVGGSGAELVGKISDIVADIMDGLIQAKQAADKIDESRKLNIETSNATKIKSAADQNKMTTDRQTNNVSQLDSIERRFSADIDKLNVKADSPEPSIATPADKALAEAAKGDMSVNLPDTNGKEQSAESKGQSAMNKALSIMQGLQMGISVGTKMWDVISNGVSGEAKYEKYARNLAEVNNLTNSVNRYRIAAAAAQKQEKEWFSSSGLFSLQNSWDVASKARDAYYSKLYEKQAKYRDQTRMDGDYLGNILIGSAAGAVTGFFASGGPWGAIVGGIAGGVAGAVTDYAQQAIGNSEYLKQQVSAINNLRIETQSKHRSFLGIGGRDQKTEDLRTWAKQRYGDDLFDENGMINTEMAEEILSTYGDKLQGETEATIKELMEISDQYKEYQEELHEYVSSLYSPLVDNMVDAMWQWFDTGRDALYAFRESAAETFRGIMSDMIKTIILKNVFNGFQEKLETLYGSFLAGGIDETTLIKEASGLTQDAVSNYEKIIPSLQSIMTTMSDEFESMGYDMHQNGGTSSGSSKVAANVTQDSIDEANGRMMAIQMILQGIWDDVNYFGGRFTTHDTEEKAPMRDVEGEEMVFVDYTPYADSLISLKQTELQQQLAIHSANMNAIGGIAEQIAESYLELQGIHDDTTAMTKAFAQLNERMYDWEQYIKKI